MSDESGRRDTKSTGTLPPTTPDAASGRGGRRGLQLPGFGGLIRLVALLVVLAVAVGAISFVVGWRPSFLHNPFKHQTIDRSEPAVLRSLETINDYHAASGHFEVVVDTQSSTKYIPSWLSGEQVLFVGVGTVDSVVSFKGLDASRVKVSPDGKSVTITLPPPTLSKPNLDLQKSYVVARQRGALTRIGNFFGGQSSDKNVYIKATQQMTSAASADGQLVNLGKQNTAGMLRGLLGALGYTNVTINFEEDKK
ncbi:DUF4230 domain-containing protein [Pseudofrankia sp. DC12]|uniref:DUF4230 domain-containing protein n=1 Tax=Pseudofrankia sp. DC12 TaxID=683315 RepID=UPI0005F842C2|nr:DUF4230 domain-containing protein [Pseudofrankia sp. DC12]